MRRIPMNEPRNITVENDTGWLSFSDQTSLDTWWQGRMYGIEYVIKAGIVRVQSLKLSFRKQNHNEDDGDFSGASTSSWEVVNVFKVGKIHISEVGKENYILTDLAIDDIIGKMLSKYRTDVTREFVRWVLTPAAEKVYELVSNIERQRA